MISGSPIGPLRRPHRREDGAAGSTGTLRLRERDQPAAEVVELLTGELVRDGLQLRGGVRLRPGGELLGPVDELVDLVELLAGQVTRADGLVHVGPDDVEARLPRDRVLVLHVQAVDLDLLGGGDLVRRQVVRRREAEDVEAAGDLGAVGRAVVPVGRPEAAEHERGRADRTAVEVADLHRVRESEKSTSEAPPWYQACTKMSRPGTGTSDGMWLTQFSCVRLQTGSL